MSEPLPFQEGDTVERYNNIESTWDDVKIITLNRPGNNAVIQFKDLDQTPAESNTITVTLDKLRPKQ